MSVGTQIDMAASACCSGGDSPRAPKPPAAPGLGAGASVIHRHARRSARGAAVRRDIAARRNIATDAAARGISTSHKCHVTSDLI